MDARSITCTRSGGQRSLSQMFSGGAGENQYKVAAGNESKHYIGSTENIRLLSLPNFVLGMGQKV